MKRGTNLSLDLFGDRLAIPEERQGDGGEHQRMLRILRAAAQGELTGRQRECVRLRYEQGKSVGEVARCLGITPATASKHLKKARARLAKVLGYCFPRAAGKACAERKNKKML